ncbi:MAG: hypothetical protein R2712_28650 [Vicinamibacterales bacterium]
MPDSLVQCAVFARAPAGRQGSGGPPLETRRLVRAPSLRLGATTGRASLEQPPGRALDADERLLVVRKRLRLAERGVGGGQLAQVDEKLRGVAELEAVALQAFQLTSDE